MTQQSASQVEGLAERSITHYAQQDIARTGVRGVGGDLGMSAKVRSFGPILVIEATGTGSEFERRPLRPGLPTIDIIFVAQGEFAYLEGGTWLTSRGPLMVAPSGLPHRVRFTGPWKFVVARVPREALLPFVPGLADEVGVYADLTIAERAMEAFLEQSVRSEDEASPSDDQTVGRMALEMAGALVRARQGKTWTSGTPQAVVRGRAFSVIAEGYADPGLDPAGVSRGAGVSLRHLQSLFADTGSSVAAEIRRERARVARAMLQDSRFDELSVDQVAEQSGFGSSVSLRRALEVFYQLTPKELRQRRDPVPEAAG